jgi:hypothetical protein
MRRHQAALTFDHHLPQLEALFCALAGHPAPRRHRAASAPAGTPHGGPA